MRYRIWTASHGHDGHFSSHELAAPMFSPVIKNRRATLPARYFSVSSTASCTLDSVETVSTPLVNPW